MIDKVLSCLLFLLAGAMIVGGLIVMFASRDASGFFLVVGGAASAYGAGRLWGGPVRLFEDQYRDFGGY